LKAPRTYVTIIWRARNSAALCPGSNIHLAISAPSSSAFWSEPYRLNLYCALRWELLGRNIPLRLTLENAALIRIARAAHRGSHGSSFSAASIVALPGAPLASSPRSSQVRQPTRVSARHLTNRRPSELAPRARRCHAIRVSANAATPAALVAPAGGTGETRVRRAVGARTIGASRRSALARGDATTTSTSTTTGTPRRNDRESDCDQAGVRFPMINAVPESVRDPIIRPASFRTTGFNLTMPR
jgi:hypothetical protein